MIDKKVQEIVGNYCKDFRTDVMKVSLASLAREAGINYKTLYSFESGLSSNIQLFYVYYDKTYNKKRFLNDLMEILKRYSNEK